MRKFQKIGATALSIMAIVVAAAAPTLYSTSAKTFELSNTPSGLDGGSVDDAQAGSIATLQALQAIFAELQVREHENDNVSIGENFFSAISHLRDTESKFRNLEWQDDREIHLGDEHPDFGYLSQRILPYFEQRDLPERMSSLFLFYSELALELRETLENILSSQHSSDLREPLLPRIRAQLLDLIFFGDMISQIGRRTYPES